VSFPAITTRKKNISRFGVVERSAVDRGVRQRGHQVVSGVRALGGGQFLCVGEHVFQRRRGPGIHRFAAPVAHDLGMLGVLVTDYAVRPAQQQPPVAVRHAE
jgi:hypothetical protein